MTAAKADSLDAEVWELQLYVAGKTSQSRRTITNLETICKKHLEGHYRLEVIDLLEHPELAASHQILALPTLVRKVPKPVRKIIGDLADANKVLVGLDLRSVED